MAGVSNYLYAPVDQTIKARIVCGAVHKNGMGLADYVAADIIACLRLFAYTRRKLICVGDSNKCFRGNIYIYDMVTHNVFYFIRKIR